MKQSSVQLIGSNQTSSHQPSVACAGCMLKGSCFPLAMEAPNIADFNAIVQRASPLHKDEHVYREEQPFTTIYAVRSGAFKAYSVSEYGEEHIAQFYLPGEIFGMDGLSRNRYATSVVALETGAICAIPFERLRELSARVPTLQRYIFRLMSQAIAADQEMITLLGKYGAERRVAAFLQRISRHQANRRLSANRVRLPLSRTDIGCYLGLTVETVSRIFSRFQKIGLLNLDNREVEILSLDWLHELASGASSRRTASPNRTTPLVSRSFDEETALTRAANVVQRRAQPTVVGRAAACA